VAELWHGTRGAGNVENLNGRHWDGELPRRGFDKGAAGEISFRGVAATLLKMPAQLWTVLLATVVIPFLFLLVEYVYHPSATVVSTLQKSGPDFCLIGLGASGSVFID
jgi:hypothetical protein